MQGARKIIHFQHLAPTSTPIVAGKSKITKQQMEIKEKNKRNTETKKLRTKRKIKKITPLEPTNTKEEATAARAPREEQKPVKGADANTRGKSDPKGGPAKNRRVSVLSPEGC